MNEEIALIAGLGNPGPRYQGTRHNAGAIFLEHLCDRYGVTLRPDKKCHGDSGRVVLDGTEVRLLVPTTYMNHSGRALAAVSAYYKIPPANILVAYDELDLPVGTARLKSGGGHGGHNGLRDIINALGTRDFHRLRIGIGHPGDASRVLDYVLGRPSREDAEAIDSAMDRALDVLPLLVAGRLQIAMSRLHARPDAGPAQDDSNGI